MKTLHDVTPDNGEGVVSLTKLTGKRISEVVGVIRHVDGHGAQFLVMRLDFTDGSHLNVGSLHDTPILAPGRGLSQPGFDAETLDALAVEMYGEEDDD